MQQSNEVDILENDILNISSELLNTLLKDHTTSSPEKQSNIFWATSDYEFLGKGYEYFSPILPELITGDHGNIIMPRVLKDKQQQQQRSKDKAEVFTPSWICNAQNNLIDSAWFGRKDVFNIENTDNNTWEINPNKITFPVGKNWKNYVSEKRLEIACGEAPYLVSRYDTTTGDFIPIEKRIGLLDRKLRIISENIEDSQLWLKAAQVAYKSVYAYEWQGDSLLLAREALLISFIEYFTAKFGRKPKLESINYIAYIISWNTWQMDGLKGVIPNSCGDRVQTDNSLFGETTTKVFPCEGCLKDDIRRHNGIYCLIKDWNAKDKETGRSGKKIRFIDLLK